MDILQAHMGSMGCIGLRNSSLCQHRPTGTHVQLLTPTVDLPQPRKCASYMQRKCSQKKLV